MKNLYETYKSSWIHIYGICCTFLYNKSAKYVTNLPIDQLTKKQTTKQTITTKQAVIPLDSNYQHEHYLPLYDQMISIIKYYLKISSY